MTAPRFIAASAALALCALVAGCSPRASRRASAAAQEASSREARGGRSPEGVTLPTTAQTEELALRGKDFEAHPDLADVPFDFDATTLNAEALRLLGRNAEILRRDPDAEVLVEGHCDERGTTEYNLALGQRRAQAVRDHYRRLGIPPSRIATLSYGEERPVCSRPDEVCWSRNRRAATLIRRQRASAAAR